MQSTRRFAALVLRGPRLPKPFHVAKQHIIFLSTRLRCHSPRATHTSPTINGQDQDRPTGEQIQGLSGRRYTIDKILQDKRTPLGRVCSARGDDEAKYVLKEIPQDWDIRKSIYDRVRNWAHARKSVDSVPERRMFIFQFLNRNMLHFAQQDVPLHGTKFIIFKEALKVLACLHARDVVQNANNILFNTQPTEEGLLELKQIQFIDLEDADYLPPNKAIKGVQLGNWMWRSPESHAQGPVKKSSDMFSFGIVCVYAVTKNVIFEVDESQLDEGIDKLAVVIERQLSYFADRESLDGLLEYLGGDKPWREVFNAIENGFIEERHPKEPLAL